MEINQKIYIKKTDGSNFHDISLLEISVTDNVMGDYFASGSFLYKDSSLADEIDDKLYIKYRNNYFYISEQPTISQNNTSNNGMCKYDLKLSDVRERLKNIPFTDEPIPNSDEKYFRNGSRTIQFYGNLTEYVARINAALLVNAPSSDPTKQWKVLFQDKYEDETGFEEVTLVDSYISDALSAIYSIYKVPYVFDGYTVYVGKPTNIIDYTFKFGQGVGLRSNDRNSKKNKIVTRIAGYGNTKNIPNGYPIIRDSDGKIVHHTYTRPYLMPTVWVNAVTKRVLQGTNDPLIDYYDAIGDDYENKINIESPSYHVEQFDKAYPTIIGAKYQDKEIDEIFFVPETNDYNDAYDSQTGEYKVPYFDLAFHAMGFDIYAQAAITGEMTLSMRSGDCRGANFKFAVDEDLFNKSFYVDGVFTPNSQYRNYEKFPDSTNKPIIIRFFKDSETFGRLYPNPYQKPKAGDKFVILDIEMPQLYIDEAQYRLDDMMKTFMKENNTHKYEYPLSFSEHFLHTHLDILNKINTNTLIKFKYNNKTLSLPIQSITITEGKTPLPKYDIKLTDEISVVFSAVGQISKNVDDLRSLISREDISVSLLKSLFHPLKGSPTVPFQTNELKVFTNALFGEFAEGVFGSGAAIRIDPKTGKSRMEVDELLVRMQAVFIKLVVDQLTHIGGELVMSPARTICESVEELETGYKCFFNGDQQFVVGDQARCQVFTGKDAKFYWRLVTEIGDNYIILSKTDAAEDSDVPKAQDNISQFGNRTDTARQNIQVLSSYGADSPSYKQYSGINSYSLIGKELNIFSATKNKITGELFLESGQEVGKELQDQKKAIEANKEYAETNIPKITQDIADMSDDNVISPSEKPTLLKEWSVIVGEYPINISQAKVFSVDSISYKSSYDLLNLLIGNNLDDFNSKWYVSGYTLRERFDNYYTEKTKLLNKFVEIARNNADDAKAKTDNFTLISGGLILTSIQKLGEWKDGEFKVQAGISGIGNNPKDIMAWFGGDRLESGDNMSSVVFRRDGSGYLAKNNIWWDANGNLSSKFNTIYIADEDVKIVLNDLTTDLKALTAKLDSYFTLETINGVKILKINYSAYTQYELSAWGYDPSTGGGGGGVRYLNQLEDVDVSTLQVDQTLKWNGTKWINTAMGGGLSKFSVYVGSTLYDSVNGVVFLPSYPVIPELPDFSKFVTTNTNQEITGEKRFLNDVILGYGNSIYSDGKKFLWAVSNGNSVLNALGGDLYLGYYNTNRIVFGKEDNFYGEINSEFLSHNKRIIAPKLDCTGIFGNTYIAHGNGDTATFAQHNMIIRSWYGIGFHGNTDQCNLLIDCRAGRVITRANNATPDIWANVFAIDSGKFVGEHAAMPYNYCRPIISWADQIDNQGYITRYSIATRRVYSTWGGMALSVGNSDAGNTGHQLVLWGYGEMSWTGNIVGWGEIAAYSSASDMRLKNITAHDYNALDIINNLSTFKYRWNDIAISIGDVFRDNQEHFGISAQEVKNIANYLVSENIVDGKYMTIKKDELVPILIKAIKELSEKIKKIEKYNNII